MQGARHSHNMEEHSINKTFPFLKENKYIFQYQDIIVCSKEFLLIKFNAIF